MEEEVDTEIMEFQATQSLSNVNETGDNDEVIYESTNNNSAVVRSAFGSTWRPPQKKAADLTSEEIQTMIVKQRLKPFKWITEEKKPGGYFTLIFQKGPGDLAVKTKYVRCENCPGVFTNSGGHLK